MKSQLLSPEVLSKAINMQKFEKQVSELEATLNSLQKQIAALDRRVSVVEEIADEYLIESGWDEDEEVGADEPRVFFHHLRNATFGGEISNLGGITIATREVADSDIIEVGVSICRDDENFEKATGRAIALERLDSDEVITFARNEDNLSVLDDFIAAVELDDVLWRDEETPALYEQLRTRELRWMIRA